MYVSLIFSSVGTQLLRLVSARHFVFFSVFFSFSFFSIDFPLWARNSCCWFVPVILFYSPFFSRLAHNLVAGNPVLIYCFFLPLLCFSHSPESLCHSFRSQSPPRHEHAVDRINGRRTKGTSGLSFRPFLNAVPMIGMGAVV
jgi:hypothetical protein